MKIKQAGAYILQTQNSEATVIREVILGKNSKVWQATSLCKEVSSRFEVAIGHADLEGFRFTSQDRVWVLAYSRSAKQNEELIDALAKANVFEIVYVSSATTIVTSLTKCYEYPRLKKLAECAISTLPNARILTIGIYYKDPKSLPSGPTIATSQYSLNQFLLSPQWPLDSPRRMNLFQLIERPFINKYELYTYRLYGLIQWKIRRWPCMLRPVDWVLRAVGVKWYGYVHLSNRLWSMTMS